MSLLNRVLWKEGLFIRPQHFQQESRFLMSQLKQVMIYRLTTLALRKSRLTKNCSPLESLDLLNVRGSCLMEHFLIYL